LRINNSGTEYDSHPHLSFDPFEDPFGDKMQAIEEKHSPAILLIIPILMIPILFRTFKKKRRRAA